MPTPQREKRATIALVALFAATLAIVLASGRSSIFGQSVPAAASVPTSHGAPRLTPATGSSPTPAIAPLQATHSRIEAPHASVNANYAVVKNFFVTDSSTSARIQQIAGSAIQSEKDGQLDESAEEPSKLATPAKETAEAIQESSRLRPQSLPTVPAGGVGATATIATRDALAGLITRAQNASPVVAAAQSRLQAAAGTTLQSSLLPNPSFGYASQEVGNDDAAGQHGFFLQKTQVRGNKIQIRQSVAQQEALARAVDLQTEMARIEIAVRRLFFQLLIAGQRVRTTRQLVTMAEETTSAIDKLVDAEEMAKTAKLQAQLAVTNLQTQHIAAEKRYQSVQRALAALLDTPPDALPSLGTEGFDQLPDYQWPQLVELAQSSLKLDRQRFVVDKAACQMELEQAKQIVDVNWQMSVYYDDSSNDVFTGLQVSRPLLWHDRNQGSIQRASADLAAEQNQVSAIVQTTLVGLTEAFQEYESQRARARLIESELLPRSRESLELTQLALVAGELGYLEALVSQQTYAQACQQYFNALDAAWQAVAQLESQFIE